MFRKKKKSLRQRRLRRRVRLEPLESRRLLAADCLQNTALPEDVNADDLITVRDALIVIEDLLTRESEGESVGSQFYTDVNGDHVVTSLDALHVIQSLIVGKSLMVSDDGPTHDANDDSRTGIDDSPGSDDLVASDDTSSHDDPATHDVMDDSSSRDDTSLDDSPHDSSMSDDNSSKSDDVRPDDSPHQSTMSDDSSGDDTSNDDHSDDSRSNDDHPSSDDSAMHDSSDDSSNDDSPSNSSTNDDVRPDDSPHQSTMSDDSADDNSSSDDSASDDSSGGNASSTSIVEFEAHLSNDSGARGKAKYEVEPEHGTEKTEFKVFVEGAPEGTYDVSVGGTVVGQIAVGATGMGQLVLSSMPDAGELPLPDDFPQVGTGTTVDVTGLFSGTMQLDDSSSSRSSDDDSGMDDSPHGERHRSSGDDSPHGDVSDDDSPHHDDSDDHSSHDDATMDDSPHDEDHDSSDDHSSSDDDSSRSDDDSDHRSSSDDDGSSAMDLEPVELEAKFRGTGRARGKAKYEVEREHGGLEMKFEVEVKKAVRGEHDVLVGGVLVGRIRIDSRGRGKLEFSSRPDEDALPLPSDFPAIGVGTPVEVVGLFTATMQPDD